MATSESIKRVSGGGSAPSMSGAGLGAGVQERGHPGSSLISACLWILGDLCIVLLALVISVREWLGTGFFRNTAPYHTNAMFNSHPAGSLGALLWFVLSLALVSRRYQLYGGMHLRNALHEQRLTVQAGLTAGLLLAGFLYLMHGEVISRGLVVLTVLISTVLLCIRRLVWRAIMYRRFERGLATRNVIIAGRGQIGQALRNHLESIRHLGYRFKGYVYIPGYDPAGPEEHGDVLGSIYELRDLARKHFADEIFLSVQCEGELVQQLVGDAREIGVDIRVIPELYDGLAWNSPVEYIGQFPTIPLHRSYVPVFGLFLKRILDVALSTLALVALSPLMAAIAIAIRWDSPGPLHYCSERIGKKGRVFRCFKFRTMVVDAEGRQAEVLHLNERDGVLFKVSNDPRVTRVGRFLRKYSLDELPQFINVLRGEMSMVGPRPPIASEVKNYELSHLRRLDVTPGMTGLWQVQARQDPSFDSYISLDTAYIENWSVWLDLKILVRTLGVVISGTGA